MSHPSRRSFLSTAAAFAASSFFVAPGAFAEELIRTPRQTEGPFYPDHLPLDTDNDLILVNDATTPAVGEITHLSGRILDASGEPIRNALVEIWQADGNGVYLNSHSGNARNRDGHSRASAGSSPARPANTTSARSSPCPTPAARRTSTWP